MHKIIISTCVVMAGLVSSNVIAQDANYEGPYVGINVGYSDHKISYKEPGVSISLSDGGLSYGAFAGYRVQTDSNLIFGLEGRYYNSSSKFAYSYLDENVSLKAGRQWGVDMHLGGVVGEGALYGLVGWADAKAIGRYNVGSESTAGDAWRFGLGYDYNVGDQGFVRLQGVHTEFDEDVVGLKITENGLNLGFGMRF